jgi:hypothetical protein
MIKRGKKAVVLASCVMFAVLTLMSLCPEIVSAHPPKAVILAYDTVTQTLSATITHTGFSKSHYIEKVEIKKNGAIIAVQEYNSQPSETFTYTYKLEAAGGDTFDVKASCSRFGSRSEKLTVGPAPAGTAK